MREGRGNVSSFRDAVAAVPRSRGTYIYRGKYSIIITVMVTRDSGNVESQHGTREATQETREHVEPTQDAGHVDTIMGYSVT